MNKITVLAKNKLTYFIKRLTEEVGTDRLQLFDPWLDDPVPGPSQLTFCRTTGVYRNDRDLEFLRTRATDSLLINPLKALTMFRSKKTQYYFFNEKEVPHLPWLDLKSCHSREVGEFLKSTGSPLFLIKPHFGQGGWGVRVMGADELTGWFECTQDREYILQPFQEGARELRYFFIDEGWSCTLERQGTLGPAANFKAGGDARVAQTPKFLPEIIREVRSEIPIMYGAMDVLIQDGKAQVLEINAVPGIEQLELLTGHNVMKELLQSFRIS